MTAWPALPAAWGAPDAAVHVVRLEVGVGMSAFEAVLTDAERARAERFRQAADRARYVAARGALRHLLAARLRGCGMETAPPDIRLAEGSWGKPVAADWPDLRFNVSHAGGDVLLALADRRDVGVDVELVRADMPLGNMVSVALTDDERAWWTSVPACDQHRAFVTLWTRKEAVAKAVGTGLGRTDVPWSPAPKDDPESVTVDGRVWTVHRLDVGPHALAAVAAEGAGWPLRVWTYGV